MIMCTYITYIYIYIYIYIYMLLVPRRSRAPEAKIRGAANSQEQVNDSEVYVDSY